MQYTFVNSHTSTGSKLPISCGVPQGSVLNRTSKLHHESFCTCSTNYGRGWSSSDNNATCYVLPVWWM